MLKKEFKEAGKVFFYYCGFSTALTVLAFMVIKLTFDQKFPLLDIVELLIHPAMLLLAFILGASFFTREKTEGAFEYLYTLPLSRQQIIATKILPRLFCLIVILSLYAAILLPIAGFQPLFNFPTLTCFYISVFFIGISLSLNRMKGAASIFQSFFHFIWSSAAFFLLFYLAVYWQFAIKDQQRYFKQENIFWKIVRDQPYGLWAAYAIFSLLLLVLFVFRFKHTDLKNHGNLAPSKFIKFTSMFVLLFFFGFFIQEYHPSGIRKPTFQYELAGSRLLQNNGYDIFIHDRDGRHRLDLDLYNQQCRLFAQQTPDGKKCFLWDGWALYRLDSESYHLHVVYSMYSDDKNLFIKKSGNRIYLGEAGWWRTGNKQTKYFSRLVTINLDTEKYTVIRADFLDTEPVFLYSADPSRNTILSEILTFKDGQIQSVNLKSGAVLKTEMRIKDSIAAIKKKYPLLSDLKPYQISPRHFEPEEKQFWPISRDELLIKFCDKEKYYFAFFQIDSQGHSFPWLPNYLHLGSDMPEINQDVIYQEVLSKKRGDQSALVKFDKIRYSDTILFNVYWPDKQYSKGLKIFHFLRSEDISNIYFYYFIEKSNKCFFYKILSDGVKLIKEIPDSFRNGNHLFEIDSFFTSGSGVVVKYKRKNWDANKYWDPDRSSKSHLQLFNPWMKNYIVKVFAFPDLKEMDFGNLGLINE